MPTEAGGACARVAHDNSPRRLTASDDEQARARREMKGMGDSLYLQAGSGPFLGSDANRVRLRRRKNTYAEPTVSGAADNGLLRESAGDPQEFLVRRRGLRDAGDVGTDA